MAKPSHRKPRRKRSENLDLERMRRLYLAMLRSSRATRNRAAQERLGTEVPALLDLRRGDVLVTSQRTAAVQLLAAANTPRRAQSSKLPSSLPLQLGTAAGLALRARDERRKALVTLFADAPDRSSWREALQFASAHKLPVVFFLFSRASGLEQLLADAQAAGVASMAVDAADSVAVYRVCQEAQLRARMGDGPAFIGAYLSRGSSRPDPLQSMAKFLREHHYPVDKWKPQARTSPKRRGGRERGDRLDVAFHVLAIRR